MDKERNKDYKKLAKLLALKKSLNLRKKAINYLIINSEDPIYVGRLKSSKFKIELIDNYLDMFEQHLNPMELEILNIHFYQKMNWEQTCTVLDIGHSTFYRIREGILQKLNNFLVRDDFNQKDTFNQGTN